MEFYFQLLTIIPLIFFFVRNRFLQFSLVGILIFFAGFRDVSVGTDTLNYFNYFNNLKFGLPVERAMEPLWKLINLFIINLGLNFSHLTFFVSLLTIIPLYKAFNRESIFPMFSWFVYLAFCYYFQSFNIMRQCLAVSWVLLGYCIFDVNFSIFHKNNRKVLLFTTFAILIHYTAVVSLAVYFIYYIVMRYNKWTLIQLGTLLFGFFFSGFLYKLALNFLPTYARFDIKEDEGGSIVNLLVLNIAFIIMAQFIKVKEKWFSLFFCYIIFSNLVVQLPFASRFMMYAGIAMTIYFPNFIKNNRLQPQLRILVWFILVAYCFFRFIRLFGGGEIFPYENILYTF